MLRIKEQETRPTLQEHDDDDDDEEEMLNKRKEKTKNKPTKCTS